MERWSYGINSIYKKASIYIETAPWWIFLIDRTIEFICNFIPPIYLPKIKIKLRDREDIELNGNEWTNLKDWYGDLRQLFHLYVHIPIFDFCQRKIECKSIEIDYNTAKKVFYKKDKKFWDKEIRCTTSPNFLDKN